jgi:hypothetical protein
MSIKLTWAVKRESGRPLAGADIDHYELGLKLDGAATYSPLTPPAPGAVSYDHVTTAPGKYDFRLVCFPKTGGASAPVTGGVEIFDTTQAVIFNFTVEVFGI